MSTVRLRRAFALLAVAVAVIAGGVFLIRAFEHRVAPKSPENLVPTVWKSARDTPMHRAHLEGPVEGHPDRKRVACRECHGDANATLDFETTDAGPPVSEAVCGKCHEDEQHRGHVRTATPKEPAKLPTCLSCHVFGANKSQARCADCHAKDHRAESAPALEHHASAEMACNTCHSVHGKDKAVLADCETCHTQTAAKHGGFAAKRTDGGAPPPDGRLEQAIALFARDAGAELAAAPRDPHAAGAGVVCTACHAPHAGKEAARATCESCHVAHAAGPTPALALGARAPRIAPRGKGVAGHRACLTCHEAHDARRADVKACAGCHADHGDATKNQGHKTCTGCHMPHGPGEGARASCSGSCHGTVKALAADRVAAHADCTSCHRPHELVASAPPAAACTKCHDKQLHALSHGKEHGKSLTCTQCHAAHDASRPTKNPTLCATCHADKTALVTARTGHADCESCHGTAHAPKPTPTCESCHAAEQHSAPTGHQKCTTCHDAHSGARKPAAATCASCHEAKAKAQHGNIAGGCQSCHRPHGPNGPAQPPACSTCHAQPTLKGLHAKPGHATCASCHTGHGKVKADRATCTSCHKDKGGHQPDATSCNGCHLFRQ